MKAKLRQTSWTNRFILLSLTILTLTNPWSVGYIGTAVDTAVVYFTLYANYVFVVGLVVLALTNIYMMYANRQKVNVSDKHYSQKTKNKNYKSSKLALLED